MQAFAQYALPAIVALSGFGALVMCLLVLKYGLEFTEMDAASAARRLLLTRIGHAAAGTCFAAITALAIVLVYGDRRSEPRPSEAGVAGARVESFAARLDELASRAANAHDRLQALGARLDAVDTRVGGVDSRVTASERTRVEMNGRIEAAESFMRRFAARLDRAFSPHPAGQAAVPSREPAMSHPPASPPARSTAPPAVAADAVPRSEPTPAATVAAPPAKAGAASRPAPPGAGTLGSPSASSAAVSEPPAKEPAAKEEPTKEPPARESPGKQPVVKQAVAKQPVPKDPSTKDASVDVGAKLQADWDAIKRDARAGGQHIRNGFGSVRRSLQRLFGSD